MNNTVNRQVLTTGIRPNNVPEGWIILNAPRPLYGPATWQGDFLNGRLYAALDPQDEDNAKTIEYNMRAMAAAEVVYISETEAAARELELFVADGYSVEQVKSHYSVSQLASRWVESFNSKQDLR